MYAHSIRAEISEALDALNPLGLKSSSPEEWFNVLGHYSLQWIYSGWTRPFAAYEAALWAQTPDMVIATLRKAHGIGKNAESWGIAVKHSRGLLKLPSQQAIS